MKSRRLYSLDALRGVGALAIVVWHWQHFYAISGTWQEGWSHAAEPLYPFLKPLYEEGWVAVDLFFAVSGFVFFWLYLEPVARREIGVGTFARQRFSRLYPLYLATLLVASAMQILFFHATGSWFIFDANDWRHFVTSLFLVQQWLPPDELQSFNGPAWAVSIEVLLYIVFFIAVRAGLRGVKGTLLIALSGAIVFFWDGQIGRGIMGFFFGGVTYYAVRWLSSQKNATAVARFAIAAAIAAWVLAVVEIYLGPIQLLFARMPQPLAGFFAGHEYPIFMMAFIFVVSPLTLAALALHEEVFGGAWSRLTFLGDISYSTYLIHFPMQLALALLALKLGWTPQSFQSIAAMMAFYGVLILLGWLAYARFERPLQALIRGVPRKTALSPVQ
ncbi:MAG TPA: acyltransferase [Rhizomicrobium sp.]